MMLLRACAGASIFALLVAAAAAEQPTPVLSLPQLQQCTAAAHPRLPPRWRAVYLMAPFDKSQLVLGEIESDSTLGAMRVRLHGVERGSIDLFVRGSQTYVLSAGECRRLGDTGWRPLPPDWLTQGSRCVGAAPIGATDVDWWRTPIEPKPASSWTWYQPSDGLPFRLVFPFAGDRLAPLSRYALNYRVDFEPLSEGKLADIASVCERAGAAKTTNAARALRRLVDAMPRAAARDDDEIKRLMPAFDPHCAAPLPHWPERLAITGLSTPIDADESPFPTEVFYDWSAPGQRTRIFSPPDSALVAQDSLLLDPQGYTVTHWRDRNEAVCKPVVPGTIRPDWPMRAPCTCAGTINGTTALSPDGTTQILVCPLASPRVAWAWYALTGKPTVFMVTSLRGDQGKRLFSVLDYRDWLPDHPAPHAAFAKPAQCPRSPASPSALRPCATCHLGRAP